MDNKEVFKIMHKSAGKPYKVPVMMSDYHLINLRWLFRWVWNNQDKFPELNNGDWFGEIPIMLVDAMHEVRIVHSTPNGKEPGPSPWDDGEILPKKL